MARFQQPYLIFNSVEPEESVAGVVCTMNQKKIERGTSTSISLLWTESRPRIFLVGLIIDAFWELASPAVETHLSISKV